MQQSSPSPDDSIEVLVDTGAEAFAQGDYVTAAMIYSDCLMRCPTDARFYTFRAHCWQRLENYDKAADDYTRAIELQPHNSSFFSDRANIWARKGDCKQALRDYDEAIRLDAKNFRAFQGRASVHRRLNNYHSAINDYSWAILYYDEKPPNADAYYWRGQCYRAIGNEAAARKDEEMAYSKTQAARGSLSLADRLTSILRKWFRLS